jgi:hypothetical protein
MIRSGAGRDAQVRPHLPLAPRPLRRCDHISFLSKNPLTELEDIGATYAGRLLRLASLAGDIMAAILEGRQPPELTGKALNGPSTHFKVVAAHELVDFIRTQAGDRRTGLGPSAGRVAGLGHHCSHHCSLQW